LSDHGRVILGASTLPQLLNGVWTSLTSAHKVIAGPAKNDVGDIDFLRELAEARHLRPLIDRSFPLERIVDAHAYVDTGRKRGSVIVTTV
jgi:NADPH:quinone reductase-like Zn-dependent oxidoreductase